MNLLLSPMKHPNAPYPSWEVPARCIRQYQTVPVVGAAVSIDVSADRKPRRLRSRIVKISITHVESTSSRITIIRRASLLEIG
jgi:hypothetical protein